MTRLPTRETRDAAATSGGTKRAAVAALALFTVVSPGLVCEPGGIRATNRPPEPRLVDEHGDVDAGGVDALIAAVERERGIGFIQHPTLELLASDDVRLASLRAAARALEPCPRTDTPSERAAEPAGSCFPDPSLEWIDCVAPPDLEQARRALRRLLDAQNHPRLVRAAAGLRGDPGVAVRALLAASANGISDRRNLATDPALPDLFDVSEVEVERRTDAAEGCIAMAEYFLSLQPDPEAPFHRPPLSTQQLVSPKRYQAGERPDVLLGDPPRIGDCALVDDESVGVARLLVERLAKGGSLPVRVLAAWRGDRGVRFACDGEPTPWIYVAELSDPAEAAAFAKVVSQLLPAEFADPSASYVIGRRVVAISRGLDSAGAIAWASALAAKPLTGLPGLD